MSLNPSHYGTAEERARRRKFAAERSAARRAAAAQQTEPQPQHFTMRPKLKPNTSMYAVCEHCGKEIRVTSITLRRDV